MQTKATCEYPTRASRNVLREVFQVLVIVGNDGQHSLATAELRAGQVFSSRNEVRDGRLAIGDDNSFAGLQRCDQFRQTLPGLLKSHCHPSFSSKATGIAF